MTLTADAPRGDSGATGAPAKQTAEQSTHVLARVASVATISDKLQLARPPPADQLIKPTLKRYLILVLFCFNAGNKAYQWLHVISVTTKATVLYDTDNYAINLTSIIFMVAYLLLSWPACFVIEHLGLRKSVLIAALGTSLGSIIKCFSCHAGGIWLLALGQMFVSASEQLVFSVPSRLASVWFPDHQVSLANALCVTGSQLGWCLGFLVPQWFLAEAESHEAIADGFRQMFLATAGASCAIFIVCAWLFDEEPKYAPGAARAQQRHLERTSAASRSASSSLWLELRDLFKQIKTLLGHKHLMLLATCYGINVGLGYTFSTLLDQLFKPIWPHDDLAVGTAGLLMCAAGVLAPPLWGRLMDRSHAYKLINLLLVLGSIGALLLFALLIGHPEPSLPATYLATFLFGLFNTGLVVAGLELAVELTYPAPELITSSMMNLMPQLYSITFILLGSHIADTYGPLAASLTFAGLLLGALLFLLATRETLARQAAIERMQRHAQLKAIASV